MMDVSSLAMTLLYLELFAMAQLPHFRLRQHAFPIGIGLTLSEMTMNFLGFAVLEISKAEITQSPTPTI
jgi:hypothetical protein